MTGRFELVGLIRLMSFVHVYWCPVGGHYGVTVGVQRECPMGCNVP